MAFVLNPTWPNFLGKATIAFAVLAGLVRYLVIDWSDPTHCRALLNSGSWLDGQLNNWQPNGCMLYHYKPEQTSTCLKSRPVTFIGDSITRTLFFHFAHTLDPTLPTAPQHNGLKHSDHDLYVQNGSHLSFLWDPYLNSTRTFDILKSARDKTHRPALLVMGSGLWYLRHANVSGGLASWEANTEHLLDAIRKSPVKPADEIVILPVEQVVRSKLNQDRALTIRPSDIDAMNSDLYHRLRPPETSGLAMFSSTTAIPVSLPLVFNQMLVESQTKDGLHFSSALVNAQAIILLNLRCNGAMPKSFPLDKTCCNQYPWPSLLQSLIIAVTILWGPTMHLCSFKRAHREEVSSRTEVWSPAIIFGAGIALIFVSDRTGLWLKEQKQFNPWTFGFLSLFSLAFGLITIKRGDKDLGFLNRDQTDEWKGWMQIAILIYHYTGASKVSGIYNPIRVLVASYLFMTGYGHTTFYIKKADFGILRIAQVLVRLNLLTICLAYTMNTNYISYYFSPLVSMWFLVIYFTMVVGSRFNDHTLFVLGKISVSAFLVTWFMKEEWLLETLFKFLNQIFRIHWSANEWNFRVTLDLWIVYAGMLAAIVTIKVRESRATDHTHWAVATKFSIGASAICIVWFFAFELLQPSKFTYNKWHPYISFLPVLAFATLRNASIILRSAYSSAFAYIGRCSLETFIIQYHFWLAGDTKGVLLVLPTTRWRPVNFVVTTIMFIYVSDQMAHATSAITGWICADGTKLSLPTVAPPDHIASTSTRRNTETSQSVSDASITIPLTATNNQKDSAPPDPLTPPIRSRRWVDRLTANPLRSSNPPWYQVWQIGSGGFGVKMRLVIGASIMWAANLLWRY